MEFYLKPWNQIKSPSETGKRKGHNNEPQNTPTCRGWAISKWYGKESPRRSGEKAGDYIATEAEGRK